MTLKDIERVCRSVKMVITWNKLQFFNALTTFGLVAICPPMNPITLPLLISAACELARAFQCPQELAEEVQGRNGAQAKGLL